MTQTLNMKIGGFLFRKNGCKVQLPWVSDPTSEEVQAILNLIKPEVGIVRLKKNPEPEIGPYAMSLHVQEGTYLVMLQEYSEDGSTQVRTPFNAQLEGNLIEFLGERYDQRTALVDFDVVKVIFNEFLKSGNVSKNFL